MTTDTPPSISGDALRAVMRRVPSAVVVVTVEIAPGVFRGMTASSFASVSLEPPLISVNVIHGSQMHSALFGASGFSINLLGVEQAHLADHFATPDLTEDEQWANIISSRHPSGAVLIDDVLGWLTCTHHTRFEAGDHTIFVGRVHACDVLRDGPPLVIHRSSYQTALPHDPV